MSPEFWRKCAASIWRVADAISHVGTWCYEKHRASQRQANIREFIRK